MPDQQRRRLGRPPIDEMPEGERRAEILRVAGFLFRQQGYAAVSLNDIAVGVHVTKATVLHHFGSKEALYAAVMHEALSRITQAIQTTAAAPEPVGEKLHHLSHAAIVWVDPDADLEAMLHDAQQHLAATTQCDIDAAHQDILGAIEEVMRQGISEGLIAPGDPRFLAHAFWQLLGGFAGRRGAKAAFQGRAEVARAIVQLFLHGVAAESLPCNDHAPYEH